MSEERYYPFEICLECGKKYGRSRSSVAIGVWSGKCGWCGTEGYVTSPRDFLYPDWPIKKVKEKSK